MDKNKVVVGLSGGVDSAVTALLLQREGYEVIGVTMRQFKEETFSKDAASVAESLGIKHVIEDLSDEFEREIMRYFASEYEKGRTPNPCTLCNPRIKWEMLTRAADREDAFYVATGHYANIDMINGRYSIKNAVTATKDQTYALCNLTQEQLSRTLMPLGRYEKSEVRAIAEEAGIPVAGKADSQDICFIPDGDYAGFLERFTGKKFEPGDFVDRDGRVLGRHNGIVHYTIGQRKGLNLPMGKPVFVTGIDVPGNRVIIGDNEDLFTTVFFVRDVNFMAGTEEDLPKTLMCKIRYAHKGEVCTLSQESDGLYRAEFAAPVRAITPGQTAVFYDGDYVFAGSVIA